MSGQSVLADTNILIYLLSGDRKVATLLNGAILFISEITEIELLSHTFDTESDLQTAEELMLVIRIIPMNAQIKAEAIVARRNHRLLLPDTIIAATARHLSIPLISADKAFSRVEGITFIQYRP